MQPLSHTGYVSCAHLCAFTTEPAYREAPVTSLFHEYLQVLIRIRTWFCFSSPRSQSSPCLVDLTILLSTRIRDEEYVLSSPSVITKHRLEDLSLNNRECWGCQHRGLLSTACRATALHSWILGLLYGRREKCAPWRTHSFTT